MKKLIAALLIIMTSTLVANAGEFGSADTNNGSGLKKSAPIEDEFIKSDAFPKVFPTYVKQTDPITDDMVIPYEKSGNTIKLWASKRGETNKVNIDDELVTPKFISGVGGISILKKYKADIIEDNFAKMNAGKNNIAKVKIKNHYDFTKTQIPVQLKIVKMLSTKHAISEGDSIIFKTVKDVDLNGKFLPKGTKVIGRIETVSDSDKMGCPANIVVDNFYVESDPDICLYGHVSKTGANRSIWVYPLYQAGNIMFYVAGFVFVPIHGGHAKLLTKEIYTVYYESGVVGNNHINTISNN